MANIMRLGGYTKSKLKLLGELSLPGAGQGNNYNVSKSATFNVKNVYEKYDKVTADDFPLPVVNNTADNGSQYGNNGSYKLSYDQSTGILKITYTASSYYNSAAVKVNIYVLDRYNL